MLLTYFVGLLVHSKLEARPIVKKIVDFGDAERQESLPRMDAAAAEAAKAQN